MVAVIGTRHSDEPFVTEGKKLVKELSKKYTIFSGLALGCDSIAHQSCLQAGGKTIAALPSPCDDNLPKTNRQLASEIVDHGELLFSEYRAGVKAHFPMPS